MNILIVEPVMCLHKSMTIMKVPRRNINLLTQIIERRVSRILLLVFDNHVVHDYARCHDFTECFMVPSVCWSANHCPRSLKYTERSFDILPRALLPCCEVAGLHLHRVSISLQKGGPSRVDAVSQVVAHVVRPPVDSEVYGSHLSLHVTGEDRRPVEHVNVVAATRHPKY